MAHAVIGIKQAGDGNHASNSRQDELADKGLKANERGLLCERKSVA